MANKNSLTPEVLEMILTKVTDKLTDAFKLLIDQVVSTLNLRIDNIEQKLIELNKQSVRKEVSPDAGATSPIPASNDQNDTVKTLLAVETEKAERVKRSCNVIISGLPPQSGVHDADIFSVFCDEHLTVKPLPVRDSCRRLGKPAVNRPAKLRITLTSSQAVDDLIQSATILRKSNDPLAKGVYINRDLTVMEAQEAYELRVKKRMANPSTHDINTQQP